MIREQEKIDDPEIESKIRSSDEDCLAAGTLSTNRDPFIVSYTLVDPLEEFITFTFFFIFPYLFITW